MSTFHFKKTEGADRELKLIPLDSELWEEYRGAYGNVRWWKEDSAVRAEKKIWKILKKLRWKTLWNSSVIR